MDISSGGWELSFLLTLNEDFILLKEKHKKILYKWPLSHCHFSLAPTTAGTFVIRSWLRSFGVSYGFSSPTPV